MDLIEELAKDLRLDFGNTAGAEDAIRLVTTGLKARGWRIVKTEECPVAGEPVSWTTPPTETVSVTEEWTP